MRAGRTDDPAVLALADRAAQAIEAQAVPRTLYRIFDCTVTADGATIGGREFCSRRLAETLSGCTQAVVFGATLGTGCDRLIQAAAACEVAYAMALQAAAACKIEEVCDDLERTLKNEQHLALRQRYSPGYFDLDITQQKDIFALLELTKRIGITLTDTCEMLPTKSVTAIIGIEIDRA